MPTSSSPFPVIVAVVNHTPPWVWGVLLSLVVLGSLQLRAGDVPRLRVALLPLGLSAYSVWGAVSLFGLHTSVLLAWVTGAAVATSLTHSLAWAPGVRHDPSTDRFHVPGSVWPLLLMLAVFAVRYGVTVTLALHHDWATDPMFASGVCAVYGSLSGLLTGRTLSILRQAQGAAPRLAF